MAAPLPRSPQKAQKAQKGRTMAHVDGRLRRLEKTFSIFRRARKETAAPETEDETV